MGYPANFHPGYMVPGVPLGMTYKQLYLTADNTAITTAGVALLLIGSDDTVAANRTFSLAASTLVGHRLTLVFTSGSSSSCQLLDTGAQVLTADWTPTQYQTLELVSDGTNWIELDRNTVAAGSVTLAMLATGIAPSHVIKYAGRHTTVGGSATEAITVTGVAATDNVAVSIRTVGGTPRTIVSQTTSTNTVTVVFSGDPAADHVVYYEVTRAAS